MFNPTLIGFIRKELLQTLRDKRMRVLLFVMPVLQMTVFGLALSTEVKNIRLALVAPPSDVLSRHIYERALASGWFRPATGGRASVDMIPAGQADAVLVAPPGGLTQAFERGEGRLQLLVDATNAVRARSIETYTRAILNETLASEHGAVRAPPPLKMEVRLLFNPSMRTADFLVPGVMSMILGLLTVILTSMSMAREKEMGTFESLIAAPVQTWEILVGKTLPYLLLGLLDVPLIVMVAMGVFRVPMRGDFWVLFVAGFFFVATMVSIGTLISTFAKNQQQAMLGGFIFLFPAIQLSGVMAPLDNIPMFFKALSYLDPMRYFVTLLRNIMLKGGDPLVVWPQVGALALLGAVSLFAAARRFHRTLN